jgi:hypothetical protein
MSYNFEIEYTKYNKTYHVFDYIEHFNTFKKLNCIEEK